MAKEYVTKNGNRITLLNPSEKGAKAWCKKNGVQSRAKKRTRR